MTTQQLNGKKFGREILSNFPRDLSLLYYAHSDFELFWRSNKESNTDIGYFYVDF